MSNTKPILTLLVILALTLAAAAPLAAADKPANPPAGGAKLVNINTADAATLDQVLLNIGPAKAQAIVEYRRENGAFRSVEQLAMVKGIGLKTVERNRDRIILGSGRTMVPVLRTGKPQQQRAATPARTPARR